MAIIFDFEHRSESQCQQQRMTHAALQVRDPCLPNREALEKLIIFGSYF